MKTIKILFLLAAVVGLSLTTFAQKPFTGTIIYDMTYEAEGLGAAEKAQFPTETVVSISGNKVRTEQSSIVFTSITITDFDLNETISLIDMEMMGLKHGIKYTKEELDKAMADAGESYPEPEIKFLDETKTIAGYKCKKAEVTVNGETTEVYYTDEINVPKGFNDDKGFKGIDGVLMEYTIEQQGLFTTAKVREVKKGKVKASLFKAPADYEIKSLEEAGSMF